MIKLGLDPYIRLDNSSENILSFLVKNRKLNNRKAFIESTISSLEFNPNTTGTGRQNFLSHAIKNDDDDLFYPLINHEKIVLSEELYSPTDQDTPLICAIIYKKPRYAQSLIEKKALAGLNRKTALKLLSCIFENNETLPIDLNISAPSYITTWQGLFIDMILPSDCPNFECNPLYQELHLYLKNQYKKDHFLPAQTLAKSTKFNVNGKFS